MYLNLDFFILLYLSTLLWKWNINNIFIESGKPIVWFLFITKLYYMTQELVTYQINKMRNTFDEKATKTLVGESFDIAQKVYQKIYEHTK